MKLIAFMISCIPFTYACFSGYCLTDEHSKASILMGNSYSNPTLSGIQYPIYSPVSSSNTFNTMSFTNPTPTPVPVPTPLPLYTSSGVPTFDYFRPKGESILDNNPIYDTAKKIPILGKSISTVGSSVQFGEMIGEKIGDYLNKK
jgi:hypothetical protein